MPNPDSQEKFSSVNPNPHRTRNKYRVGLHSEAALS
jgi:hypothetical protein